MVLLQRIDYFPEKVVFSGKSKVFGNVVVVHGKQLDAVYAGLSKVSPDVVVGKELAQASAIDTVKEKMIFQTVQNGKIVDPMSVIGESIR